MMEKTQFVRRVSVALDFRLINSVCDLFFSCSVEVSDLVFIESTLIVKSKVNFE